jgi:hypothetical protein
MDFVTKGVQVDETLVVVLDPSIFGKITFLNGFSEIYMIFFLI